MSRVFVLDSRRTPLCPCHPARARQLLRDGKAAVLRRYPLTIILQRVVDEVATSPLRLKIDPGSKVTGLAIVDDSNGAVVFAAEVAHRGAYISDRLKKRQTQRRARRHRKTRYRKARFVNRLKAPGWLPPSLLSRLGNIETWVRRLCCLAPIMALSVELVTFNQQTLQGKDAAAVFSTRQALLERLQQTGLAVEVGNGVQTATNRAQQNLPKKHWIDAACIGSSTPKQLQVRAISVLKIKATGHGRRQRCRTDKYGFPKGHAPKAKFFMGFQTGDIVRANIPKGKYAGVHTGRIAIRFRPCFRVNGIDVHPKYLRLMHRSDGYAYTTDWFAG